jgi:vancomycin aglycone glucosyltransferase
VRVLPAYGSRGDVGPVAEFALRSRALCAEVQVSAAPPDKEFPERLAGVGMPLGPAGGWR